MRKRQIVCQCTTQEECCHRPADGGVKNLSRKHISVTCAKCMNKGHNYRTCNWKSIS